MAGDTYTGDNRSERQLREQVDFLVADWLGATWLFATGQE